MKIAVDPRLKSWYVCFTENTHYRFWFTPLLKKGFAHCYAYTFDVEADRWILYDPTWQGTTIRAFTHTQMERILTEIAKTDIILQVDVSDKPFYTRHFQSCVTLIANLVGVNVFIPTPYRLFCALKKNGAQYSLLSSIDAEKADGRNSQNLFTTKAKTSRA